GDGYKLAFTDATAAAFKALNDYDVKVVDGKAKVTPYTITEDDIIAANPHFTTVYGDTTTPVEVKIKGVNGDEEISNTATTTAYIYDENGNPIKTEHVGDTYDIESTLTNSNYQFEGGKTSKVFDNTASVTKANLTVNVGNAETVYGTPFDTSKYDYAYSTETGKSLVNGDTKESLLKDLGTIGYDNEAALDGTDGKWTAAVGDGYKLAFTDATAAAFKALNDYDVKVVDGKAKVTPYTITKKDIVDGNPHFTTVYGDTTTPVEVAIKGVNGDATVGNTATTSAYEYGTDGTPVKTKDVGDKIYDITSVLTNKNYRFEDGSDTKLFANTASVTPADLTIQIGNASTVYGTKFDEKKYGYNYAAGITNGDTEETLNAALGGMNYTNDAALDGTNGKWTREVGNYDLTGKGANSLTNYKVTYLNGTATVTPLNITEDNVNDFITNATYTTVYGSKADFGQAVFTGVNGDGTRDLSITGSSALTGNTEGVITKDAAENAYNTVVSLDGLSEQDKKNYSLEDTSSFTFDNSATVEKADLTVSRKGIETVYGTVKKDPGDMTTYTALVNGDTNDIVIDNGNYGTAYNDELTKTNNVGKYDYKATLNSDSDVLRNYNVHDDGMNYVNITPLNITEDNVNDFITNATYTTVYGSKADFGQAVFTGVNGDGTRDLSITGSSALTGNTEGVITKDAAENAYNTVVSLDGLSEQDKKNYSLEDTSSFTFDNSATVEKADLTVSRKGIETVYGTVKKDPGDMTTYTTLVNGDTNDIVIDNGNYGTAYNDDLTKTNNVGKYDYKATLNSASDVLRNYNVIDKGTNYVNITPLNITEDNVNDFITNATYTTVYGSKADFGQAVFTGVNGDGTRDLSITGSSALTGNTEGVITKDAAENAYNTVVSLDGLSEQDKKNYSLEDTSSFTFDNSATVEKADLTVSRKGIETVYGTVKKDPGDMTTYTDLVNGDTNDIVIDNGNYGTAYNDELTKTNNVGKYNYKATLNSESDVLRNYNVHDDGTNYVNITPYTITDQEVVNLDGSPLYTTKYGQKDAFGTATFTGVNGDGTYELAITDSSALATAGAGKVTKDVGKNIYDTTVELSEAMNGNYQFADGATSKTFEKTASVTPAELTIKTKDVETEYGTVKTTTSEVEGLVNGDLPTGFIYDYGNYGGAYLDGNTKTNDVNTYHFGTTLSGAEFLKNYTITGGEADVKIDPKDVTFFVSGTGNTLTDVTYTVDPDIDAQLAYGEHVDADYTPGNDLGSNQYGVVAHINGTPIVTGDVAGNYRYNYGGLITLSPTVPTKPDIDPHNPSNLDGSGSWTSNMGNHGVPGVERVAGLASAELPFFKVEAGQVSHYGTYDVAADPDKVRLEPTGKRLPEPNQPKTQYREYTKALTTTDGTGMFRMVYDGSTFNITPVDDGALALMRMGDVKNNVELSAEALHAGFSEMGILLEDLDGVYVHFDTMA
ncbi:beta strand repeat-containing protein, partial [Mitsuokella multacida]|uniref:beta strand repeat-containing protein n=1 Tax=Mitsuokella multacida TaxID=52226 RepID=UPI0039F5C403